MKRWLWLLVLLLASPCFAAGPEIFMGSGVSAAAGGDGWFGNSTLGTAEDGGGGAIVCSVVAAPSCTGTCTVSKIAFYHAQTYNATPSYISLSLGLYTSVGGVPTTRVGTETRFDNIVYNLSFEYYEYTVNYPGLTCGADYYICYNTNSANIREKNEVGGNQYYYQFLPYATAWPSPYTATGPSNYIGTLKAYFTY